MIKSFIKKICNPQQKTLPLYCIDYEIEGTLIKKIKNMKEVIQLARVVNTSGTLEILPKEYESYPAAQADIANQPPGKYQIQKFFVVG